MQNQTTSFIGACQTFFGRKPGQTLLQFRDEMKALTDADKNELWDGLVAIGFDIREVREAAEPVAKAA